VIPLRRCRPSGSGNGLPPGRAQKTESRDRELGRVQEGWAAPRLNRAQRNGGRRTANTQLYGCSRKTDGIRQLDKRGVEKRAGFERLGGRQKNDLHNKVSKVPKLKESLCDFSVLLELKPTILSPEPSPREKENPVPVDILWM
jgi:hypothetical protein